MRTKRTKILTGLVWSLLTTSWALFLLAVTNPLYPYPAFTLAVPIGLSVICCVALWRLLRERQAFLFAISFAGMTSFLASYLLMLLNGVGF
jgi:hypothetical protein